MICSRTSLLVTCACAGFAAEPTPSPDAPAPAPIPVVTAAAPSVAPVAATAPVATTNRVRPVRVAEVEKLPPRLRFTATMDGMYDSNVLLLPDTASGSAPTKQSTPIVGTEARIDWRAWNSREGFLKLGGVARNDNYQEPPSDRPGHTVDSNSRFGANLITAWTPSKQNWIPSFALSSTRYQLDGKDIANDVFGRGAIAWRSTRSVELAAFDVHHLAYDDAALEGRIGTLFAGSYRHWIMFGDNDPSRRLDLGLRAGRYVAHANTETYTTARPDVQFAWRFGDGGETNNLRLTVGTGLEWRSYAEAYTVQEQERQVISISDAVLAYGLAEGSWVGPMASFGRRVDNLPDRTYNRWMAGVRFQISIP